MGSCAGLLGPGCSLCPAQLSHDALSRPHAQLLVRSAALGVEQHCVTALLHSTLPCPSQLLSRLPAASPSWCLQQRHLWDPFPLVLLRALSSIALRWDTELLLGSSCALRSLSQVGDVPCPPGSGAAPSGSVPLRCAVGVGVHEARWPGSAPIPGVAAAVPLPSPSSSAVPGVMMCNSWCGSCGSHSLPTEAPVELCHPQSCLQEVGCSTEAGAVVGGCQGSVRMELGCTGVVVGWRWHSAVEAVPGWFWVVPVRCCDDARWCWDGAAAPPLCSTRSPQPSSMECVALLAARCPVPVWHRTAIGSGRACGASQRCP